MNFVSPVHSACLTSKSINQSFALVKVEVALLVPWVRIWTSRKSVFLELLSLLSASLKCVQPAQSSITGWLLDLMPEKQDNLLISLLLSVKW